MMMHRRDAFLDHLSGERRLSPLTVKAYASDLCDFARHSGAQATGVDAVKAYLHHLTTDRQASVATVKRRLAALRCYFAWAADDPETDPFGGWRPRMKRPRRLPRALSADELARLIGGREAREGRDRALRLLLRLLTATGLRVGELCALDAGDAAPDGSSLRVRGKGARERIVYVTHSPLAAAVAREARGRAAEMPLFTGASGGRLSPAGVRARLHRLAQERGCARRITPHMFRHTAATLLIEKGVDIRHIQRLLGHASIATTEIYTHVADESLRRTLARADVLNGIGA